MLGDEMRGCVQFFFLSYMGGGQVVVLGLRIVFLGGGGSFDLVWLGGSVFVIGLVVFFI